MVEALIPRRITEAERGRHVNLLLLTKGKIKHYCLIVDFDRLCAKANRHVGKKYFCYHCIRPLYSANKLQMHRELCMRHEATRVELAYNKTLKFNNFKFAIKVPYVIYADFECVIDHDHRTGLYRGAAHNQCNLQYRVSKKIPVVFHNLQNYDGHLIVQELEKYMAARKVNVIARDMEKYISFSINNLQFLDSYNYLKASLDELASNLTEFRFVTEPLLRKKGCYPYEYMDGAAKFEETCLPSIEHFYSSLRKTDITTTEYDHAQEVWSRFNVTNMRQYHDLYMETDVKLLAEVFEAFRELALRDYGIDRCHVYSLPGLTWQAALKMTREVAELTRDATMHLFIEEGIRGGVSMITTKFSRANNPYMSNYDPSQESKYIIYLDCNALYSTAMMEKLPHSGFQWTSYADYLANTDKNVGYIMQVDLEYPPELHDLHNDYPLAPDRK